MNDAHACFVLCACAEIVHCAVYNIGFKSLDKWLLDIPFISMAWRERRVFCYDSTSELFDILNIFTITALSMFEPVSRLWRHEIAKSWFLMNVFHETKEQRYNLEGIQDLKNSQNAIIEEYLTFFTNRVPTPRYLPIKGLELQPRGPELQ